MKYRENLENARNHGIDVSKADLAYEVECVFCEEPLNDEDFEFVCSLAYWAWLKFEDAYKNQVVHAIKNAMAEGLELEDIHKNEIGKQLTILSL